jgi:integrase
MLAMRAHRQRNGNSTPSHCCGNHHLSKVRVVGTDLRAGELAGLRLEDVELDRITVNRSIWGGEEQDPKTRSAVRTIAVSPQLATLLWQEVAKQKTAGRSHLFTVPSGSPLDMDVYRQRKLKPTLEALELPQAGFMHSDTSMSPCWTRYGFR